MSIAATNDFGSTWKGMSMPVPMEVWSETVLANPMAGNVAVPTIRTTSRRDVHGGVSRDTEGDRDVLAEVLVQLGHGGRAEHDTAPARARAP